MKKQNPLPVSITSHTIPIGVETGGRLQQSTRAKLTCCKLTSLVKPTACHHKYLTKDWSSIGTKTSGIWISLINCNSKSGGLADNAEGVNVSSLRAYIFQQSKGIKPGEETRLQGCSYHNAINLPFCGDRVKSSSNHTEDILHVQTQSSVRQPNPSLSHLIHISTSFLTSLLSSSTILQPGTVTP